MSVYESAEIVFVAFIVIDGKNAFDLYLYGKIELGIFFFIFCMSFFRCLYSLCILTGTERDLSSL